MDVPLGVKIELQQSAAKKETPPTDGARALRSGGVAWMVDPSLDRPVRTNPMYAYAWDPMQWPCHLLCYATLRAAPMTWP
jgi:hypothetical protein